MNKTVPRFLRRAIFLFLFSFPLLAFSQQFGVEIGIENTQLYGKYLTGTGTSSVGYGISGTFFYPVADNLEIQTSLGISGLKASNLPGDYLYSYENSIMQDEQILASSPRFTGISFPVNVNYYFGNFSGFQPGIFAGGFVDYFFQIKSINTIAKDYATEVIYEYSKVDANSKFKKANLGLQAGITGKFASQSMVYYWQIGYRYGFSDLFNAGQSTYLQPVLTMHNFFVKISFTFSNGGA